MVHLTDEMKAQLMKVTGITEMSEFDNLVKQAAPEIENFDQTLQQHSPFDLQMVLFRDQLENRGLQSYQSLKSIEEKVKYIYDTLMKDSEFKNIDNVYLSVKSNKNAEKSKKLRDLGNKNFQSKVHEEAIRYYNESVMAAPITDGVSNEASLSLGNRSVVLFNLCEYENCLSDISAALHFGYPENLQYKIYERQGKCQQALGLFSDAKKSYEVAKKLLEKAKVAEAKKPEIIKDLNQCIIEVSSQSAQNPVSLLTKEKYKIWNCHKQFPKMSESVDIVYQEDVGRHGIAKADIAAGELIVVEDPLAWTVNVAQFEDVCQCCLRYVGRTPIPSSQHQNALFCCYKCLVHYKEIFKYDDLKLVELFSAGVSESSASTMLAFRCLVQKPLSFYLKNREKLFSDYNPEYGVNEEETWIFQGDENIYKGIYNLVNHMDKITLEKELTVMIKTAVLLRFLVTKGYFNEDSKTLAASENQSYIGKLLYMFQLGMNHNQHGVYAADGKIEAGKKLPLLDIGAAYYSNIVLFNHSCAPNTIRINQGNRTYLVAKNCIKKGEEIFDCYGQHHLSNSKVDRKKLISSAFIFDCKCKACLESYPMWSEIESRLTPGEMSKLGTSLSKYQSCFKELKFDEAQKHCSEYLRKLDEMKIMMPHRNYEIASMALSSCYWANLQ